jgi:hypothetical protein
MPQKTTAKILLPSLLRPLSIDPLYLLQFDSPYPVNCGIAGQNKKMEVSFPGYGIIQRSCLYNPGSKLPKQIN